MQRNARRRLQRPIAAVTAVLVASLVLVVVPSSSPPASAGVIDWTQDTWSALSGSCNWLADAGDRLRNDPTALVGAGSLVAGQLSIATALNGGALAGQGGYVMLGGGAAVSSGSTVGGTASAAGAFMGSTAVGVTAVAVAVPVAAMTVAMCGRAFKADLAANRVRIGAGASSERYAVPGGPIANWGQQVAVVPCPEGTASSVTFCVRFLWDSSPTGSKWFYGARGTNVYAGFGASVVNSSSAYPDAGGYWGPASSSTAGYMTVGVTCGTDPTCYQKATGYLGLYGEFPGYGYSVVDIMTTGGAAMWTAATGQPWRGQKRQLRATTTCKVPGTSTYTVAEMSQAFWDVDAAPAWLPEGCGTGAAPIRQTIVRERIGGGEAGVTVSDVQLPTAVQNNPTTLQCWVIGVTSCPIVDLGNGTEAVGGATGVVQSKLSPTLKSTTQTALATPTAEWLAGGDPVPTTTTTPVTTTTPPPTTTTMPSAGEADPPGPPVAPAGDPDGGSAWSTCLVERTSGAFDDVNINPVTWVRAIVWWMVAPIICAVWWLFVPPGGWGVLVADLRDLWANAPALSPIRAFSESLTVDTSRCFPVDLPDVAGIDVPTIDVALCGNPVVTMVWGVAVALGVLAIAREAIRTVSRLAAFDSVTGGFDSDSQYYMR